MLLEAWRSFEQSTATPSAAAVAAVERRMPKRIKRKRPIQTDEGLDAGMEVRILLDGSSTLRKQHLQQEADPAFLKSRKLQWVQDSAVNALLPQEITMSDFLFLAGILRLHFPRRGGGSATPQNPGGS